MPATLAFDIYGTLIDTHGVVTLLQQIMGDRAQHFSNEWRNKQLEYSFRRGLMRQYQHFGICTSQALDYTDSALNAGLNPEQKAALLDEYRRLPAFDDVVESLTALKGAGHKLFAFSNGTSDAVNGLLIHAGIDAFFDDVISVDTLQTFKPNPDVYTYMVNSGGAPAAKTWLISSNPFDVIGAVSAELQAAWVRRSETAIFDPWGINPTISVASLTELSEKIGSN